LGGPVVKKQVEVGEKPVFPGALLTLKPEQHILLVGHYMPGITDLEFAGKEL
jgi:hypothetical protein